MKRAIGCDDAGVLIADCNEVVDTVRRILVVDGDGARVEPTFRLSVDCDDTNGKDRRFITLRVDCNGTDVESFVTIGRMFGMDTNGTGVQMSGSPDASVSIFVTIV